MLNSKKIAPIILGLLSYFSVLPKKALAVFPTGDNPAINGINSFGINTPSTIADYVSFILNIIITVGTLGVFIMAAVGAFTYLTGSGNEEQTKKGTNMMINAGIGFAILAASWAAIVWLIKITTGGSANVGI